MSSLLPALAALTLLAGPPAEKPAEKPKEPTQLVLVEAKGANAEVEAFLSRFLFEVTERANVGIADARLSGGVLGDLAADIKGEAATQFREANKGDGWIGIEVGPCMVEARDATVPKVTQHPLTGRDVTTFETIRTFFGTCTASYKLVDANDGHVVKTVAVKGSATVTAVEGMADSYDAAASDAADQLAKKLYLKRIKTK